MARAEAGRLRIGVLASQGDFAAHLAMLRSLGAEALEVRGPAQLDGLDGLVIPGGESTTMMKAIARDRLEGPIRGHLAGGAPILGTCAGMIVCDRDHLGLVEIACRRNAFGRQIASFEADLELAGIGPEPLRAVFIRAPWVEPESIGPEVEVLAEIDGHAVAVREGQAILCSFHPELTDDSRVHALLMAMATAARQDPERPRTGARELRGESE
ncbi:MAG: pyridoxal 5-phosphate synthase pdxT subunit [Solirubrobacterales bacterium]|jgi:5'-phosphate synthase pdxT subunit|nr:pyridoxal 5-phosphate synthase pdxT subunit [Solirubrobacterales bacterium]